MWYLKCVLMNSLSILYQPVFTQYGNNNFLILFFLILMCTHTDFQKINEKIIENAKNVCKNLHEYILSELKLLYQEYESLSHDKRYVNCSAF